MWNHLQISAEGQVNALEAGHVSKGIWKLLQTVAGGQVNMLKIP